MTLRLLLAAAGLALPAAANAAPFDRAAWKADFERVKAGIAQGYANLDWQVDKRGINLARADGQIGAMLDKANSDAEAVLVFAKIVEAFDDPHFTLEPGLPASSATLVPRQSHSGAPLVDSKACAAANYRDGKSASPLPYAAAPGWRGVADGPFLAGTIGKIGVVRIPSFDESRYLAACQRVAKPDMEPHALRLATRAELNRELTRIIGQLRAAGATRLAVDVAGNGGGSEWSSEVAAMLTARTLTRQAPRLAAPACDRASVWQGKRPCPIYAAPAESESVKGSGIWSGPLALLVDRRSASATEELITWMKSSPDTVVVGERSFGAGCGYVDGGHAIAFKAAPIHLMMPNCSRFTASGVNEIEGIAPDIAVEWTAQSAATMPALLARAFDR